MARSHPIHRNRHNGSLVAATLVVFMGAAGAAAVMAGGGADPVLALFVVGGAIVLIGLLIYLCSVSPAVGASLYGWVASRYARPEPLDYRPALKSSGEHVCYGSNAPPTADDVRELKDSINTWVPSGARTRSKRRG